MRLLLAVTVLLVHLVLLPPVVSIDESDATPTVAPTGHNTTAAPSPTGNKTLAPTGNATSAPTSSGNKTAAPTSGNETKAPTQTPTTMAPSTSVPTDTPTYSPTEFPTSAPTAPKKKHASIGRIIGKTIAYLILMLLGVLFFGACMSNRYRIYYFLRGCWYTILGLQCTRRLMEKLGMRRGESGNGALNELIFEPSDLSEGLLMSRNGLDS